MMNFALKMILIQTARRSSDVRFDLKMKILQ